VTRSLVVSIAYSSRDVTRDHAAANPPAVQVVRSAGALEAPVQVEETEHQQRSLHDPEESPHGWSFAIEALS
jgi:hypothetical protein